MRESKSKSRPPNNILPPCRVCGEPGSGFHYGVTTCGACKGFFRRSLKRDEPYECAQSQSCLVGPSTVRRQTCPKCRLEKCVAVGMCKEACKFGRYSLIKKSKDIEEVMKRREAFHCLQPPTENGHGSEWSRGYPRTGPGITLTSSQHFDVSANTQFPNRNRDNNLFSSSTGNDPRVGFRHSRGGETSILEDNHTKYPIKDARQDTNSYYDTGRIHSENRDDHSCNRTGIDTATLSMIRPECAINTIRGVTNVANASIPGLSTQIAGTNSNTPSYAVLGLFKGTTNKSQPQHLMNHNHPPFEITSCGNQQQPYNPDITNGITPPSSLPSLMPTTTVSFSGHTSNDMITSELVAYSLGVISDSSYSQRISHYNECDSKSDATVVSYNEIKLENNTSIFGTCKRPMAESDEEKQSNPKKQLEEAGALVPVLEGKRDKKSEPVVMCIVEPDPMKTVLSIFEKFPLKSFEKKSLGPLLKLCYKAHDWVDEYLTSTTSQHGSTRRTELYPQQKIIPPKVPLSFTNSSETTLSAQGVTYDTEEMATLLKHLKAAHCRYWGPESAFMTTSDKKTYLQMFQKMCELQEYLQGSLNLIDDDKYFSVLEATGIDVDNRKAWFTCTFSGFDEYFTKDSKFFLALPGFKNFPVKDRIALTKATAMVYPSIKQCDSIDFEKDLCIDELVGFATRISTLKRVIPDCSLINDDWTSVLDELKDLDLSIEEFIVLKALIIMLPDYDFDFEDARLVTQWHNVYLKCLLYLERMIHGPNGDDRFNRIIGILHTLKKCRDLVMGRRDLRKDTFNCLNDRKGQPLFHEVFVNS